MRDQERPDRHSDTADYPQHKHAGGEQYNAVAGHQPSNGQQHQYKAKNKLTFKGDNFHQPSIKKNRYQDTCVQEGKSITHTGNGNIKVLCDIIKDHPGHND